ncbi:MAG: YgiQ family radical SAM protein [Desulfitobacteriaceae bacterium]
MRNSGFLPVDTDTMRERGWNELDFLIITGDAYVDHPSFGIAIIARVLENANFRVGIIAQPKWQKLEALRIMGKPRLACLISGGNLDSMVNHYTAAKKKRSKDAYSPGGNIGFRPDRATIVYANRVREALPGTPIIIGGIEASLRRFAHYDYWSNQVRRSILLDSQADMLVYGMGEKPIIEIAEKLSAGITISQIQGIRGTMVPWREDPPERTLVLPDFNQVQSDKRSYAKSFWVQYQQQDPIRGEIMYQKHDREGVLQYPPAMPLSQAEMDRIYSLPYAGTYHPQYQELGGVPAIEEVEFSLVSARGCYGACSFCALTFHQGRIIQSRSAESIIREAERLTWNPRFKGYIHDVGGPTANFRRPSCTEQLTKGTCNHRQCLYPQPCNKLDSNHREYIDLLRRLRELPRVKKIFVRSGVRYDVILADRQSDFLQELCEHHVSGQLKVAPEHVSETVLKYMGKPGKQVYENFVRRFQAINQEIGKKQYLVPYLMSSHPGSSLKEAIELAEYIRDMGVNPEQVQDFIPTPGTLSTCMYFTELDPRTMQKVYIPKSLHEKAMQRALIQYRNPKNYDLVKEALILEHREDLIGFSPKCLIKPRKINPKRSHNSQSSIQGEEKIIRDGSKPYQKEQQKKGKNIPKKVNVKHKTGDKSIALYDKLSNKRNVRKKQGIK